MICLAAEDVNTRNNQSSYIGYSAGNQAVYQKVLASSRGTWLQLLTIVYYYFVATTRLYTSCAVAQLLPGYHFVALGGGGGA